MLKKYLSLAIVLCFIAVNTMPAGVLAADADDVITPVYYMDFSPDTDGKFYDSPAGTEGRMEVARLDNPASVAQLPNDNGNVDDKIISTDTSGRIYAGQQTANLYAAFSKGESDGDQNNGASGKADDYCLKTVDNEWNISNTSPLTITFPKSYGGTDDICHRYRYEMDFKWQQYKTSAGNYISETAGSIANATIFRFYIGDKELNLKSKADGETADARGGGALYFECSGLGLNASGQKTDAEDVEKVTKSASAFTSAESGKWIHVTVDFDFASGTIYAKFEGDSETREISTVITSGQASFANGVSAFRMLGSSKGARRINYVDNIKLSTVVSQLTDEQILENAVKEGYTFDDIKGSNKSSLDVTEDLYLPSGKDGVGVTWSVAPSSASKFINLVTGAVTRPTHVDGNQTVSLTPSYSLNGLTKQGTSIDNIVLKALDPADYPLEAEYYMDFSPRSDGNFYDYPENIPGGTQVKTIALSDNSVIFNGHTAVDDSCIALDADDNISKIQPGVRTLNDYVVFSKGTANGDVNTGASGNKDDYCLKMIDTSTDSNPSVRINLPKSYGNPETSDDYVKYRFEMDYKWQHYSSMTSTSSDRPTGTIWLRFYFGDNYINLYSKSGSEHTEVPDKNGAGALCFTSTAFGMGATTNQLVPPGQSGKITAPMFSSTASGNWVHVTVDFDFEESTIKAVLKGENGEERIIETSVPEGTGAGGASFKELFMEGLSAVSIHGATGGNRRVIWADNIKISPMATMKKTPSEKLYDANNPATSFEDIKGANSDASAVTENLALIFKKGDADVSWEVSPSIGSKYINVSSGLVTRPSFVKGDQRVTLIPTYTVAGRKLTGDSIDITVSALPESVLEKMERLITTSPFTFADIKGANTSSDSVSEDLLLPSSAEGDISVIWSVLPEEMSQFVDCASGKITRPKYTDTDKTFKLVPTYKHGEIEMIGELIELTVAKNTLEASGPDVEDAYAILESDLVGKGQSLAKLTGNLNLPAKGKIYASDIEWSASSLIVDVKTGAIKRPFGAAKANIVLTATVTNGTSSTKREFNVTIVDTNYGSGNKYSGGGSSGGSSGGGVAFAGSSVANTTSKPDDSEKNQIFSDIETVTWAKPYIEKLYNAGVVNGDGNGLFYPERNVTREEFVKMLLLSFDISSDGAPSVEFNDVEKGSWYEEYVSTAYSLGIVNGISSSEFGSGRFITRQDMAVMIVRCLEHKGISLDAISEGTFADEDAIYGYALDAVKKLKSAGILNGDTKGNFNPASYATRAEVAKVLGMMITEN